MSNSHKKIQWAQISYLKKIYLTLRLSEIMHFETFKICCLTVKKILIFQKIYYDIFNFIIVFNWIHI